MQNVKTLNEYQIAAKVFAVYPEQYPGEQNLQAGQPTYKSVCGLNYTVLGLAGEAGEYADKFKKLMRDDDFRLTETRRSAMAAELGDVLWYVAESARQLGYTLEEIANMNIHKLNGRVTNNTLQGSGDNR